MTFQAEGDLDSRIMLTGIQLGLFMVIRHRALVLPKDGAGKSLEDGVGDAWRDVEARFVWGGRSLPEVSHAMLALRSELETAKERGDSLREVKLVMVTDGNHFVRGFQSCARGVTLT